MIAPAQRLGPEVQVLCCAEPGCHEALNGWTFYPEVFEGKPNPYRGRCRGCGSMKFTVGLMKGVDIERYSRPPHNVWFLPFHHDLSRVKDPFVKNNIFVMG